MIAEAQRRGGICAFIDAEHAMDPTYAKQIGVNIDELLVSQPDTGEQALEITELLIRSGALAVVAIDSVAALTPKAEIEGEMGDSHVGLQARLMSQALRKLAGTLNRTDTICIFTNQLREKIGVMFGNPETTPGGRALKFYASVRLDIRRIETLKDGVEAIGNRVRVKVAKNKVAPPFKQAEFDIIYGEGISWEGTVLDVGLERKIVQKSGSYFSFGDERLGQGRQNATAFLKEHPDLVQQILQRDPAAVAARPDRLGPPPAAARAGRRDACRRRPGGGGARGRRGGRRGGGGRRLSGSATVDAADHRAPRRARRAGAGRARRRCLADASRRCDRRGAGSRSGSELDRARARELARALRRVAGAHRGHGGARPAATARRPGSTAYLGARGDRPGGAGAGGRDARAGSATSTTPASRRIVRRSSPRRATATRGSAAGLEQAGPRRRADRRGACGARAGGRAGARSRRAVAT